MDRIWQYLVEIHTAGQWAMLVQFYGAAMAFVVLVILLIIRTRGGRLAVTAARLAHSIEEEVRKLPATLEQIEIGLENRLIKKMDQKVDAVEAHARELHNRQSDLLEERTAELAGNIGKAEAGIQATNAQVEALRRHLGEVEDRIPSLLDRLDELRDAVAERCQGELANVLGSFDNTVRAVLTQMKGELQVGVSRIESIESMIHSRKRAETNLLGTASRAELLESPEIGGSAWQREEAAAQSASEAGQGPAPEPAGEVPAETRGPDGERLELDDAPQPEAPERPWFSEDNEEAEEDQGIFPQGASRDEQKDEQ